MFNSYVQLPDPGWYLIVPSRNQKYPSWWMKTSLANAAALDPRLSPLFEWRIAYPAIPIRLSSMIPVRSSQLKQNWSPIWICSYIFSMLSMLMLFKEHAVSTLDQAPGSLERWLFLFWEFLTAWGRFQPRFMRMGKPWLRPMVFPKVWSYKFYKATKMNVVPSGKLT